jgi:hypothetical protein
VVAIGNLFEGVAELKIDYRLDTGFISPKYFPVREVAAME